MLGKYLDKFFDLYAKCRIVMRVVGRSRREGARDNLIIMMPDGSEVTFDNADVSWLEATLDAYEWAVLRKRPLNITHSHFTLTITRPVDCEFIVEPPRRNKEVV